MWLIEFPVSACAKLQSTKQKYPSVLVSKQEVRRNDKSGVSNTFLKLSAPSQHYLMHFVTFCGRQIFLTLVFQGKDTLEVWKHISLGIKTVLLPIIKLRQGWHLFTFQALELICLFRGRRNSVCKETPKVPQISLVWKERGGLRLEFLTKKIDI